MKKIIIVILLITSLVLISGCTSPTDNKTEQNISPIVQNITQHVDITNVTQNNSIIKEVENRVNVSNEINSTINATSKYGNNTNLATIKTWRSARNGGSSSTGGSGSSSSNSDDNSDDISVDVSSDTTDEQNASDEINIAPDNE